ncbi:hypothetical protein FOZ60_008286 [Perkinsus olseni]|uniref:FZ domain-containing protein n=1 Tax=Perkinsus olseni TaxID=32597 RepID=A0A7J6PF90_PEROL|nr:hypothetical protein FOZ60_008286 [Perkinsus olseni]
MPVARHSDLGKLLTLGVFIVQAGGVRFGEPENQVNILYDVRTPPYLKHGACFEHPVFGQMPSSERAPSGLYTPPHMLSAVSIEKVLRDRCREISRTHGLDCSRVALAELSPVTGADNNFDDINIGIEDNGKTEGLVSIFGDILSSSFINNQRLDPRWLSLDSEDSEAKSRVAAGGDLAMFDFHAGDRYIFSAVLAGLGSDAAQRQASQLISATSATMAKHIAEAAVASLLSAVPSSAPPPIWNDKPLPCMPLPEGDTYEKCYTAFMSMQCASMFPMCTVPQASEISVVGIGKVPLCSTLCHNVLAQCPGFNLNDVSGPCDSSSVPPVCAMAHFYRVDDMPPQYSTFDEYEPFSDKCPPFDPTLVFAGDHSLLEAVRRVQ